MKIKYKILELKKINAENLKNNKCENINPYDKW